MYKIFFSKAKSAGWSLGGHIDLLYNVNITSEKRRAQDFAVSYLGGCLCISKTVIASLLINRIFARSSARVRSQWQTRQRYSESYVTTEVSG